MECVLEGHSTVVLILEFYSIINSLLQLRRRQTLY
ncbi:hypothetical protein BT93_E0381 [Corymbia citriodora subsp. variegata]|nr:hypothetical protein BT93_E0381 [Corymbia citriodora subsp. variegata]